MAIIGRLHKLMYSRPTLRSPHVRQDSERGDDMCGLADFLSVLVQCSCWLLLQLFLSRRQLLLPPPLLLLLLLLLLFFSSCCYPKPVKSCN